MAKVSINTGTEQFSVKNVIEQVIWQTSHEC